MRRPLIPATCVISNPFIPLVLPLVVPTCYRLFDAGSPQAQRVVVLQRGQRAKRQLRGQVKARYRAGARVRSHGLHSGKACYIHPDVYTEGPTCRMAARRVKYSWLLLMDGPLSDPPKARLREGREGPECRCCKAEDRGKGGVKVRIGLAGICNSTWGI